jgi:hypothetical protein
MQVPGDLPKVNQVAQFKIILILPRHH